MRTLAGTPPGDRPAGRVASGDVADQLPIARAGGDDARPRARDRDAGSRDASARRVGRTARLRICRRVRGRARGRRTGRLGGCGWPGSDGRARGRRGRGLASWAHRLGGRRSDARVGPGRRRRARGWANSRRLPGSGLGRPRAGAAGAVAPRSVAARLVDDRHGRPGGARRLAPSAAVGASRVGSWRSRASSSSSCSWRAPVPGCSCPRRT